MKQVNFSHPGGFPLEQETLERLQTAYRSELYEAIKSHLSIVPGKNYIIAHAQGGKQGWIVIHQDGEGILYPMTGSVTNYLKTTRKITNLIYGDGTSQKAYTDYYGEYVTALGSPVTNDNETIKYYDLSDLNTFETVKSIQAIEEIIAGIENRTKTIETTIPAIDNRVKTIEIAIPTIDTRINTIKNDLESYLPLDGSKAMKGDLNLGTHQLYLNNSNTNSNGSLLILDNLNKVVKSNTMIEKLIERIEILEGKSSTPSAPPIPIGMIAIWGKPAPFPEGWEEYEPLRGRMPVGLYNPNPQERAQQFSQRSYFQDLTFYNNNGTMTWPFDTLEAVGGKVAKNISIDEMPQHSHNISLVDEEGVGAPAGGDPNGKTNGTGSTQTAGNGQSFPILNPYRVVHFIQYTGRSSSGVNLTASNTSLTSTVLNWTPANADFNVTSYLVYQNDILVATLGNVLTYTATGLAAGKLYNFYIIAKNATGTSAPSNTASITTIEDDVKPSAPAYITSSITPQNQIRIDWSASTDNVAIKHYLLYIKSFGGEYTLLGTIQSPDTYFITSGITNQLYYFVVQAVDTSDNYSSFSDPTSAIIESTGGGNAGGCFDVESLVTMASGQSKKLKNVVIGDKLQGLTFPNEIDESDGDYMLWNGFLSEASKAEVIVVNKKTSVQPAYYEIETEDTTFKVTGQHPLLATEDGENLKWVCTKDVSQNMLLIDKAGKTKAIKSITYKEEPLEVALLDVETVDNYVISGIVAHNNKPAEENPNGN